MTINRVLQFLHPHCECQRRQQIVDRFRDAAETVEAVIGTDVIELCVPSQNSLDRDREPEISFFVRYEMAVCNEPSEARSHVAHELRLLAVLLDDCAEKLFSDGKGVPS